MGKAGNVRPGNQQVAPTPGKQAGIEKFEAKPPAGLNADGTAYAEGRNAGLRERSGRLSYEAVHTGGTGSADQEAAGPAA